MPYDPITLLSTLSTIALPPDTQDSLSVSWLDSYRMGFPPMKHYTLCWAHTDRLPVMAVPHANILSENVGRYKRFPAFFISHLPTRQNRVKIRHHRKEGLDGKGCCIVPIDGCPHADCNGVFFIGCFKIFVCCA